MRNVIRRLRWSRFDYNLVLLEIGCSYGASLIKIGSAGDSYVDEERNQEAPLKPIQL